MTFISLMLAKNINAQALMCSIKIPTPAHKVHD